MIAKCLQCGSEFVTYPSVVKDGHGKYCSKGCVKSSGALSAGAINSNKKRWEYHKTVMVGRVCAVCGKQFNCYPSALKHHPVLYCSRVCSGIGLSKTHRGENHHNWNGGKKVKKCVVCGIEFQVKPEQEKRTGAKYCSLNCRSIYNVRHKHNNKATDIENIIENILIQHGISYQKQVPIGGMALVDFLLEGHKIIECDGDYWHNLPKTKARDLQKDKYFSENNYKVLRLKGEEIKKCTDKCRDAILKMSVVS